MQGQREFQFYVLVQKWAWQGQSRDRANMLKHSCGFCGPDSSLWPVAVSPKAAVSEVSRVLFADLSDVALC